MKRALALLAAALLGAGAAATARAQNPFASDLSVEDEQEMTAQIHAQLRAQAKLVNDPVLLAYVNEVGNGLVSITEGVPR